MFIRKSGNGNNYICRKPFGSSNNTGTKEEKVYRNWFIVRSGATNGYVSLGKGSALSFPKEWIGKKVMFKVEIIED